jgi:polysaccharide export outer membrane protein
MRKCRYIWLAVLLAAPGNSSFGQSDSSKPQADNKPVSEKDKSANASADAPAVKPATDDPNYVIGPEDELIVTVWREPDISRTVPVRPDGKISLSLLNDVQASGLTPMQLGTEITSRLTKFISAPQVTVIVAKVSTQRIFVAGEVGRAGAYAFVPGMTVLEAISSAGGVTPFAKQSKVSILRMENGKQVRLPVNYKEVLNGRRPEQNVSLKPGDTIVVP